MNQGRSFTHKITAEWKKSWELLSSDGSHLLRFNRKGNFCAILGSSSSYISLWDFTFGSVCANRISIPTSMRGCRANNLEWSDINDKLVLSFIPKGKALAKIVFNQSTDLLIANVSNCLVETVLRLPFVVSTIAYLSSSSCRLVVSNIEFGSYAVVDTSTHSINLLKFHKDSTNFQSPMCCYPLAVHQLEEASSVVTEGEASKLAFWAELHSDSVNMNIKKPSTFTMLDRHLIQRFEPESVGAAHGMLLHIENDESGSACALNKVAISAQGELNSILECMNLNSFGECVTIVRIDRTRYLALISSEHNACVISLKDMTCVWELRSALTSTSFATSATTDICLIGCGFIPDDCAVTNKNFYSAIAIGFASKNVDFRFHKQVYIFQVGGAEMPRVEVLNIPKNLDFSRLESCPFVPLLLAHTSYDEVVLLSRKLNSDFAGPMYPSGFKLMKAIDSYIEREDELDKVVYNEDRCSGASRVMSASYSSLSIQETSSIEQFMQLMEEDIDLFGLPLDAKAGETVIKLPYSTDCIERFSSPSSSSSSKNSKKRQLTDMKSDEHSEPNSIAVSTEEVKLFLDHLLPIPMSIKVGQFASKIAKEKKVSDDTERSRLKKWLVQDKIAMFDRLQDEERRRKVERKRFDFEKKRKKTAEMEKEERIRVAHEDKDRKEDTENVEKTILGNVDDSSRMYVDGSPARGSDIDMFYDSNISNEIDNLPPTYSIDPCDEDASINSHPPVDPCDEDASINREAPPTPSEGTEADVCDTEAFNEAVTTTAVCDTALAI